MIPRNAIWVLAAAPLLCGGMAAPAAAQTKVIATPAQKIGNGRVWGYVALDAGGAPLALGVSMEPGALEGLPKEPNSTSRCFDKDGDGKHGPHECIGDYQLVFALPQGEGGQAVAPFKWIGFNWNPHGHMPPAPPPWSEPHFDFHFYIAERAAVKALKPGSCGELIDCGQFKRATRPVAARYVHADHINVDAAVPDMGNHLIDSKAPELAKGGPKFTHTFIFGAYDGGITFYEPMITREFLASKPMMCQPIKQPRAWALAGTYPTRYCVRHLGKVNRYTVSLEGFVAREAQ